MKRKFNYKRAGYLVLLTCSLFLAGCEKILEVDPPIDKTSNITVYTDAGSAITAITGLYASMCGSFSIANGDSGIPLRSTVLSDEMDTGPNAGGLMLFYINDIADYDPSDIWKNLYGSYIFRVNSLIEGISGSAQIDEQTKTRILGEAKFLRAFYYFYLVNFYGDVPIVLTTDYKVNSNIGRSPLMDVYQQMVLDLKDAEAALTTTYLGNDLAITTNERIRPNQYAAQALLARVYLYMKDWTNAELESTKVIAAPDFELLSDLNSVFLKNSRETIWQLQPNQQNPYGMGINTGDGQYIIPLDESTVPNVYASSWLKAAFEPGDARKGNWLKEVTPSAGGTTYLMPYKYKIGMDNNAPSTEYTMILRLAEQYLIRAEARAKLGKITGAESAESDLNKVRNRAGIGNTKASTPEQMMDAILKERQTELFTEWANRWFDLKRTDRVNEIMSVVTPTKTAYAAGVWQPYKALFPIPNDQFRINPALKGHQNPGYSELP